METSNHNICSIARIVIEAATPMKIGSGRSSVKTDAVIARDVNGLPYIPGTTLTGLMRHAMEQTADGKEQAERIMGYQSKKEGQGSWLAVTEAKVLGGDGLPVDGLRKPHDIIADPFLSRFAQMPIRQHVRIGHKGTTEKSGKFDEEIIPKGTRFCFEIELLSDGEHADNDFSSLLSILMSDTFRVGGGSRKGFGKIAVVDIRTRRLNLMNEQDLRAYLGKTSDLSEDWEGFDSTFKAEEKKDDAVRYELHLHPVDFIFFSNGLGDPGNGTDKAAIRETFITWSRNGKGVEIPERQEAKTSLVVPASSVKGAIAHRTAFYYNQHGGVFSDMLSDDKDKIRLATKRNKAVVALFGTEGEEKGSKGKRRGHVLVSDIIREQLSDTKPKILNHVKIDRFTGGAVDGALYDEEPLYAQNEDLVLTFTLFPDKETKDDFVTESFEEALKDVCRGMLPLGGNVNHGGGCFHGKLIKNGQIFYKYEQD